MRAAGCAHLFVIDFFDIVTSSATTRMHFSLPQFLKIISESQSPIFYHDMVDDTAHKYELRDTRRSFLTEIARSTCGDSWFPLDALAIADTSNFTPYIQTPCRQSRKISEND